MTQVRNVIETILNTIATSLRVPVIVVLLFLLFYSIYQVGKVFVEYRKEHRYMTVYAPQFLDTLRADPEHTVSLIEESELLRRQKDALLELTRHPDFTEDLRASLADNLLRKEQDHYNRILKKTDLVAKLGPMFGLLGTLIPLGPGIIALGQGDMVTLSASLRTAFDTTVIGLVAAAICLMLSTIRRRWYGIYIDDLETIADCVLELEENR